MAMLSDNFGCSPVNLCEVLGIKRPLILAPMPKVSGGALAAAVSDAGGLWVVGGGRASELAAVIEPVRRQYAAAEVAADMSVRVVFVGEGIDAIDSIRPAIETARRFHTVSGSQ